MAEFVKKNGHTVIHSGGVEVLPGVGGDYVNEFTIKQEICVGCNMCSLVCPVQGCITMIEIDTGKPPMTWNEYQKLLAEGKVEKIAPPEHV